MKRLLIFLVFSSLVIVCVACQRTELSEFPINDGCTVVYATDGEQALGGNNEDSFEPFTRIWFLPGENGDYGRVYVGGSNFFSQGGMNDQGLFFDAMSLTSRVGVPQGDKEAVSGPVLIDRIMRECGRVDCVIDYFDTYHASDIWKHQFLFGDASGNSVIIEPLNVVMMEGNYQVGTNFKQSVVNPATDTFWRYQTATEMLENTTDLSVEFIRDVMDAVHVDTTQYSTVYDLKGQVVYLYHFHDFENVVVFNLREELAQGAHAYDIASLFPENPEWEQWARPIIDQYELFIESNIDSSISPSIYDAYVGTYMIPEDLFYGAESMSVVADGISLWFTFPTGFQLEFFPKSETSFFNVDSDGSGIMDEVNFDVGEGGKATQLEFVHDETSYTCERQSDDILLDLIPILQVEKPDSETGNEIVKDENAVPDPLWIALIAGGVILLGGGLFFILRSKEH